MKTIKKIAVAVDFSENARTAYKYAKALAKEIKAEVQLIHCYTIPVNPYSTNSLGFIPSIEQQLRNALTSLMRFAHDKNVRCYVHIGPAGDKLVELSKENHFDLLVISNSDERGLLTKLFGSVALEVAHKAHCPVLLVPHKAKYKGITDIAYATSEMSADEDGIAVVTDWAKSHNAKIHFLHVTQPHKFSELPDVTAMMRSHKGVDYAVKDLEFVSIKGGIDTYCDTRPIDMIVSMTRDYSFWDSLFRNSVTDYLAWNNTLPLLVLHKDVVEAK